MDYQYIYHWSPHRPKEKSWACIHRDDEFHYWNGIGPDKDGNMYERELRIYYGETPIDAWENKEIKTLTDNSNKTFNNN